MIKGTIKKELSIKNIEKLISPYDVFLRYMPNKWKLNEVTHSPFRRDDNPSFIIGNKKGPILFKAFGDDKVKGDFIKFVQLIFNVSFVEALSIINKDFNLNLTDYTNIEYNQVDYTNYNKKEDYNQFSYKQVKIQIITRSFTDLELDYWKQYHITKQELIKHNIYSISKLYYNKELLYLNPNELRFGYLYKDKWKVYTPYSTKNKWFPNNVPNNVIDNIDTIKNCNKPIWITKSKKDLITLLKFYPYVISVQNEGTSAFTKENLEFIKNNSTKQILIFDNDKPGVRACKELTQKLGMDYFNISRNYISDGITDPSDLVKQYNLKTLEKQLKLKKLL